MVIFREGEGCCGRCFHLRQQDCPGNCLSGGAAQQLTWPAKPVIWMVQLPRREERLRSRPIPPMWEGGVLKLRTRSLGKAGPSLPAYVAIEACFMEWCNHPDGEEMGLAPPPCPHTAGQARLKVRQSRPKSMKG